MRSVKSALFVLGSATLAANLMLACSGDDGRTEFVNEADGGRSPSLPGTSTAPTTTATSTPPPPPGEDDAGSKVDNGDAGDAGDSGGGTLYPDAGDEGGTNVPPTVDAGATGTACLTPNAIQEQSCGLCGVQYRLCGPSDEDAGAYVWHEWGYCQNEIVDGCVPGTTANESCGLCGTRLKVCQNDCRWAAGACKNEPANACQPGTIDFQEGLSCTEGGRSRTCEATCTYGPFGSCHTNEPPMPTLTLPTAQSGKASVELTLSTTEKLPRLSGTCPSGSTNNADRPSNWIKVINPNATSVKVTLWTMKSTKTGAPNAIDTVMASYGKTFPSTPSMREACVSGVNDSCSSSTAGDATACANSWAGLVGTSAVTVGADSHVFVWVGGWSDSAVGDYQLVGRVDTIN